MLTHDGEEGSSGSGNTVTPRSQSVPAEYGGVGDIWYYHKDHLGSSALITNDNGLVTQQVEYLPYGEVFLEKQRSTDDYLSPYRFNGKELDEETGLYYYGARYMNPRLSIWYATDPMQEKYPNISSYAYCAGNPVILFDYNGKEPTTEEAARMAGYVYGDNSVKLIGGWHPSRRVITNVDFNNDNTGFKSMLFERSKNGKTEYTYAFAGTDFKNYNDWENNALQLMGMSKQYESAMNNARIMSKNIKEKLTFVGHSLGGGLAAASAYATGGRAITFNAAGVSPLTIAPNKRAKIDAYITYRDELNLAQFASPKLPNVNGTIHFCLGDAKLLGHSIENFYKPSIYSRIYNGAKDKIIRIMNSFEEHFNPRNWIPF